MTENPIIAFGNHVRRYPPDESFNDAEYEACMRRAFVDRHAKFITLDTNMRGQRFVAAAAAWAIEKGWLYETNYWEGDQGGAGEYALTQLGKGAMGF